MKFSPAAELRTSLGSNIRFFGSTTSRLLLVGFLKLNQRSANEDSSDESHFLYGPQFVVVVAALLPKEGKRDTSVDLLQLELQRRSGGVSSRSSSSFGCWPELNPVSKLLQLARELNHLPVTKVVARTKSMLEEPVDAKACFFLLCFALLGLAADDGNKLLVPLFE